MLTGDLSDFSLRDVLEFLSTARTSGLLTLRCTTIDGGVFLRDGEVCLGLVDVTRLPLGSRMLALGLVDRATLVDAAGRSEHATTFGLACGLMRAASDAAAATRLGADQTRESVGWLVRRDKARFVLDSTVDVDPWPFAPLAVEQLLVDAERSAARWAELREVIDDLSVVPSCMADPSSRMDVGLTAAQWRIVTLVDGRRSINEIIELSGLAQMETCQVLAGMVDAGLVELVRPGGHSVVEMLLHDVRAVDALAFGRGGPSRDGASHPGQPQWPAAIDPGVVMTSGDTAAMPMVLPAGGEHAIDGPDGADDAVTSGRPVPDDVNAGLLNRLIDGGRER